MSDPFIETWPRDRLADDNTQIPTLKSSDRVRPASSEHPPASPTKNSKASSGGNDEPKSIGPDPETDPAKFQLWVLHRGGFNALEVKEVFRIFDFQKPRQDQDPLVLDRIEELLNLRGTRWPNPETRIRLLGSKVLTVLDKVMGRLEWIQRTSIWNEEAGKALITYAPADPKRPNTKRLPTWLPYHSLFLNEKDDIVNALQQIRLEAQPEKTDTEKIRNGSDLYQKSEDLVHQGTIGAIVEDELTKKQFVLTAGHVIPATRLNASTVNTAFVRTSLSTCIEQHSFS